MKLLSLFDGMGCGMIALKELGVTVTKYYSSELDKFANHQTKLNFPGIIQIGDVTKWKEWDIDWNIDLVIGGSPCQGFSFAGKQLAFDDPRSKLFFVFVEILNHVKKINPNVKFLLENVDMKKDHLRIISEYLGIFPVNINSNLVSAQNRNRWYWTNIRTKKIGLFEELYTNIPQPEDKGILLKDILQDESEVDEKYYLNELALNRIERKTYSNPQIDPEKTGTLNCDNNSSRLSFDSGTTLIKVDKKGIIKSDQNKSGCLTGGGHSGGNHSDMDIICVAQRGRESGQQFEENKTGKTNAITSVQKDNLVMNDYKLRRLTPTECSRLQTIPEWYIWDVSNTQQYKMLGNGWTVEVIKHIFKYL